MWPKEEEYSFWEEKILRHLGLDIMINVWVNKESLNWVMNYVCANTTVYRINKLFATRVNISSDLS